MRIRQYLKKMQLSFPNSSFTLNYVPQPIICQLNQSKWDALTFTSLNEKQEGTKICLSMDEHTENPNNKGVQSNVLSLGAHIHEDKEQRVLEKSGKMKESQKAKGKEKIVIIDDSGDERAENPKNKGVRRNVISLGVHIPENQEKRVSDKRGKMKENRKAKGKAKVVVIDDEMTFCTEVDRDEWQCGNPVKHEFGMCDHHWKSVSTPVVKKRKQPLKVSSSSSKRRNGEKEVYETPVNKKKAQEYIYY